MKITQITELSKSRSKVYIEQEFAFVLYKGELRQYRLREGEELSESTYRAIMQEVLPKRAKLRAINLLQSRDYTTAKLREKLREGLYPESVVEQAIAYVASFHYIDDLRYAVSYITCHEESKSCRRIEQDLIAKGVDKTTLEKAWLEWEKQGGRRNEFEMIQRLLLKKHYDPERTDYKEQQKLFAYLMRKGFGGEQIRKALRADFTIDNS